MLLGSYIMRRLTIASKINELKLAISAGMVLRSLNRHSTSSAAVVVAVVAPDRMILGHISEDMLVPRRAIVVLLTAPRAVATRDDICHPLVAAAALALQLAWVVALVHVLQSVHAQGAGIAGTEMAMEPVIRIAHIQEHLVCCRPCPPHLGAQDGVIILVESASALAVQTTSPAGGVKPARLRTVRADLFRAGQLCIGEIITFIVRQHVDRLQVVPQTEGSLVCLQIHTRSHV